MIYKRQKYVYYDMLHRYSVNRKLKQLAQTAVQFKQMP